MQLSLNTLKANVTFDFLKDKLEKASEWETVEFDKESRQKLEKRLRFVCKHDPYAYESTGNGLELNSTAEYRVCESDKSCRNLSECSPDPVELGGKLN